MAKLADVVAVLQEQNKTLGSVEANLSKILAEDVARKKKDASEKKEEEKKDDIPAKSKSVTADVKEMINGLKDYHGDLWDTINYEYTPGKKGSYAHLQDVQKVRHKAVKKFLA